MWAPGLNRESKISILKATFDYYTTFIYVVKQVGNECEFNSQAKATDFEERDFKI